MAVTAILMFDNFKIKVIIDYKAKRQKQKKKSKKIGGNMKSRAINVSSIIFVIFVLLLSTLSRAAGKLSEEEEMQNLHATALLALTNENLTSAEKSFNSAGKIAISIKSWPGCVESGYGLLACNRPEDGIKFFDKANNFSSEKNDWRGCFSAGVVLVNLPPDLGAHNKGMSFLVNARTISEKTKDWRGLIETAKIAVEIKDIKLASACLDSSKRIAENEESGEGLRESARLFKQIGMKKEAKECYGLAKNFKDDSKQIVPLPLGWKAAGETVAGPKEISPETQRALRESADMQIKENLAYDKQQEKLKVEKQKINAERYQYANTYTPYYSYPFPYYSRWSPFGRSYVGRWASTRLGFYYQRGGTYYRFDYWR